MRMEPSHSRETRASWTTTKGQPARDITGTRVGMLILGTRFNMVNAGGGQSVSQEAHGGRKVRRGVFIVTRSEDGIDVLKHTCSLEPKRTAGPKQSCTTETQSAEADYDPRIAPSIDHPSTFQVRTLRLAVKQCDVVWKTLRISLGQRPTDFEQLREACRARKIDLRVTNQLGGAVALNVERGSTCA